MKRRTKGDGQVRLVWLIRYCAMRIYECLTVLGFRGWEYVKKRGYNFGFLDQVCTNGLENIQGGWYVNAYEKRRIVLKIRLSTKRVMLYCIIFGLCVSRDL